MRDTIDFTEVGLSAPEPKNQREVLQLILSEKGLIRHLMKKNIDATEEDADDMVQEIALSLVNSSRNIDLEDFLSNRVYRERIYKNKIIDKYRSAVTRDKTESHTIPSSRLSSFTEGDDKIYDVNTMYQLNSLDVEGKLDIEKFFRKLFSEIDKKVKTKVIKSASGEKMKLILERRMQGYTIKEIGSEIGITESAVGLITSKLREMFPEYEEVWKIVKAPTHERDDHDVVLGVEIYKERLERVLSDLKNSSFPLSQKDRASELVIEWYLDDSLRSKVSLEEYLISKGYRFNSNQMAAIRRNIERLAGVPINFSLIIRNSV